MPEPSGPYLPLAGTPGQTTVTQAADAAPSRLASEALPSFHSLAATAPADGGVAPGDRLGDFDLLRLLGAGSFGRVFLARQSSLGRLVALKVTPRPGGEALALAPLEHDHIVRVFSEAHDDRLGLGLMCMQYVPGATLRRLLEALAGRDRARLTGQDLLDALDVEGVEEGPGPGATAERRLLADADWVEAVCWVGARLAEALAYAHERGVLHLDVKPANVLIHRGGRPLLADFNVSRRGDAGDDQPFGGTPAYMAPEHLDAFNPAEATTPAAVDGRADVYSLGAVLFEMLTGARPFAPRGDLAGSRTLSDMAAERRAGAPSPRARWPQVPAVLDRAVRRCLEPDPARRYQTASELARALDGCGRWRRAERRMPPPGPLARAAGRFPLAAGIVLPLLPHVVGAALSVCYNVLCVAAALEGEGQRWAVLPLALAYSAAAFVCTGWSTYRCSAPVARAQARLDRGPTPGEDEVAAARRHSLANTRRALVLSLLGWLPGAVLLPLQLQWLTGPVGPSVHAHFAVSFTLAGLIALPYCAFAAEFLAVRQAWPRLWLDAAGMREAAGRELAGSRGRLLLLQVLAGLVPLAGAVLLVVTAPEQFTPGGYQTFRLLLLALVVLGMAGLTLTLLAGHRLGQALQALTGPDPGGESPGGSGAGGGE